MKKSKGIFVGFILILSTYFVIHHSLIILHVGPTNPISLAAKPITYTYTSTVFNQNWHLFAPEPVRQNAKLYMQVDTGEKVIEDEWIDISSSLIEENHSKIITPYNRIVRLVDGISTDLEGNTQDDVIVQYLNKVEEKDEDHKKNIEEMNRIIKSEKNYGETNLYRYASAYSKSLFPNTEVQKLRVKVLKYEVIPFSERNNPKAEPELISSKTFEWKKPIEDIVEFY